MKHMECAMRGRGSGAGGLERRHPAVANQCGLVRMEMLDKADIADWLARCHMCSYKSFSLHGT